MCFCDTLLIISGSSVIYSFSYRLWRALWPALFMSVKERLWWSIVTFRKYYFIVNFNTWGGTTETHLQKVSWTFLECHCAGGEVKTQKHLRIVGGLIVEFISTSVFQSYNSLTRVCSRSQGWSKSLQLCCSMWAEELQLCPRGWIEWRGFIIFCEAWWGLCLCFRILEWDNE